MTENRDRPALATALTELGPGGITIADVGARWGAADAWFRLKPLAKLIGFDADPVECARLNTEGDPAAEHFYPVALGRSDGPATLYVTTHPGCSSLYPPSARAARDHPGLEPFTKLLKTADIQLARLDTWAKSANIAPIDFLKLDVQGAELDILTGAGDRLDACLGVEAEVAFSPMYDGQPLFADVDQFLRKRGFTFWRFDSLAHYSDNPGQPLGPTESTIYYDSTPTTHPVGSGRLVWANAIYLRDRRSRADRRSLLVLAALLEALGDPDGSRCCLADATLATRFAAPAESFDAYHTRRIRLTCSCRDADAIPKVPGAGEVFVENGVRIQKMHNGVKVVAGGYHGEWMRTIIEQLAGHHEPQEEKLFDAIVRTVPPGSTMIEFGAFWAYYSLWFAHAVPDARLILVEPDPANLEVGKRNLALNGRTAELVQASVGREPLPPRPFPCESDGQTRMLPEVCLDGIQDRFNVDRAEIVLADIQGAEVAMLEGAAESIRAGKVRYMVISTHHPSISLDPLTHQKCLDFVTAHGGHVLAESCAEESFSGDGLIVASFDPADAGMPPVAISRNDLANSLYKAG